ncbi:MAG: cupredoxin domain-containing protein [Candidatus Andersenbacteria bacterium]
MKTSAIIITIGVILILAIAGLAFFRSTGEEVVSPDPTPPENTFEPVADPFQQEVEFEPQAPSDGQNAASATPVVEATEPTSQEATIRISETGFSPTQLTVAAGTTVTFVNDGQALHWPASDLHPTHTALPGFDAKRGLPTGETYSYTFTEVGTWRFHDHLNPQETGTVVVE